MTIDINLDSELLVQAMKVGHLTDASETVQLALQEFIQKRQAQDVIDLFNHIEVEEDYDHKAMRNR